MNEYRIATDVSAGSKWEMLVAAAVPSMCIPIWAHGPDHHENGEVVCVCPNVEIAVDVVRALNFAEQHRERGF